MVKARFNVQNFNIQQKDARGQSDIRNKQGIYGRCCLIRQCTFRYLARNVNVLIIKPYVAATKCSPRRYIVCG